MVFDLSTAKPIRKADTGFDLNTARPVDSVNRLPDDQLSEINRLNENPGNKEFMYIPGQNVNVELPKGGIGRFWNMAKRAFDSGNKGTERSQLGSQVFSGDKSPEIEARIAELDKELASPDPIVGVLPPPEEGWASYVAKAIAEELPNVMGFMHSGLETGLVTGGTTMAAAAIPGPQQPFIAGLSTLTFGAGFTAGSLEYAYRQMAGDSFLEYRNFTDDEGNKLPEDLARLGAFMTGVVGAGMEAAPMGLLFRMLPGTRKVFEKAGLKATEAIKFPKSTKIMKDFLFNMAQIAAAEGITEVAQEGTQIEIGELLKQFAKTSGEFEPVSTTEVLDRMKEAGIKGAIVGGALGGAATGVSTAVDVAAPATKAAKTTPEEGIEDIKTEEAKSLLEELEKEESPEILTGDLDSVGLEAPRKRAKRAVINAVKRVINEKPAPDDAPQAALHKRIQEIIEERLPDKATREAVVKGRIEDIDDQIVAVEREIDTLEELKAKTDKPSKTLQNKIDKKERERDFLDSSRAELLITEETAAFKEAAKGEVKIKGEKVARLSLKAEESGIRRGLREGTKATKENIKQANKNIRDLVNSSSLETADKKALLALAKFDNKEDFLKILPELRSKISEVFDRTERRGLVSDIKDAVKKVKKAKNISVDIVRAIEGLVNDIDLVKRTDKTKNRLQNTLDFINRELEAGRDIQIPKSVLKKLETLNKIPIEDLTNEDLQSLLNQINTLADQGKLKLKLRKQQKETRQQKRNQAIREDAIPLEEREARRPKGVRGQLGRVDGVKNAFDRAINVAKRKFIAITPMDVVFDKMSKTGNYKGAMHTVFKQTIDKSNNKFLKQEAVIKDRILNAIGDLKIKESSYDPIGVMAALQQEGGREKLLANGYTDRELTDFEVKGLAANEQKLLDMMREEFDKLKPAVLDVMKRVYNKDFTSVKDYFPMMTDFKAMADFEIKNMFGKDAELIGDGTSNRALTKDVEQGFTIERKGGRNRIKVDAVDVFLKHVTNATYLINMAQDIRELGELAATNEFRESVGDLGQEITTEWIDLLARQGSKQGYRTNVFDTFRKNAGWVVLGYKLSSALIQPTALMDGAALIGRYAFKGAMNVGLDANWRTFLKNNFTELQARIADDPAYAEFMNNKSGKGILGRVRRGSFWGLRKLDSITASAIAAGAYEKVVTEKGGVVDFANPDADAILEAELIMRRSQASGQFKDAPSALTQGAFTGSIRADKLIFQFQSFMLNRWSLIQHDMIHNGVRLGQTTESLNIATWLMLAVITEVALRRGAEEIIAAATGTGDDLEDVEDEFISKLAMETVRTVPIIGQIVSSLNYGSIPVPIISLTQQAIRRANIAIRTKDDEKKFKNAVLAVGLLSGEIGGIPGTLQIDQIIRKVWKTN
jgi:hypothetical protein